MNRIDQLLQQMIAETSQQVLPTVYSATMLAGLKELQGLIGSIEAQRAFAKQPTGAVPSEWKMVPVDATLEMVEAFRARATASSRGKILNVRNALNDAIAAAPPAPVAQEPVTRKPVAVVDANDDSMWADILPDASVKVGDLLYTAPRATEQPDAWTPSGADYDRNIHRNPDAAAWADLFVATFPGLADKHDLMLGWFANAMMAMHDFLKATEQPDTVAVPRDVLRACRESLADGLETVGSAEAEWSTKDRALVASIDALLAGGAE